MAELSSDVDSWIQERLFNAVPMAIAVIDTDFDVVYANQAFERWFGPWKGKKCFTVYKDRDSHCPRCEGAETFRDGLPRITEEVGYDDDGHPTRYVKHTVPIADENGKIRFLVEMSTDITQLVQLRKEHHLLFDQVPCNVSLIDRDLRIVRANERIRQTFGDVEGLHCFQVFKGLRDKCPDCPAQQTFEDGGVHTGMATAQSSEGKTIQLQVTTAPLELGDNGPEMVMELAVDVTKTLQLEDELKLAHVFLQTLIATSMDGIAALNHQGAVTVFNAAARHIFDVDQDTRLSRQDLDVMLPPGLVARISSEPDPVYLDEAVITTMRGGKKPVRLVGVQLVSGDRFLGVALSLQDLRRVKQLEREKLEAERLAAVGQTVAGLAHGVKNLITGLEGGMYMLNTGLTKSKPQRIQQGWEMLERNIARISVFVKGFLSYSKGRRIAVAPTDPPGIAQEVVQLYATRAESLGIELTHELTGPVGMAPLDREGIHECLTNLVGNAIDACEMAEPSQSGYHVRVRTLDEPEAIIYEVSDDGCGMDYEVKRKVFTTFFTTKGLGGTGIGLLTTRKIVSEHGGRIELESEPGKGTLFRIVLPRNRLPLPGRLSDPPTSTPPSTLP